MSYQLDAADKTRRDVASKTIRKHKAEFGQFMTPSTVARFMASLFSPIKENEVRLLDAGAGVGALSCAFLDGLSGVASMPLRIEAVAYEIDEKLRPHLVQHLQAYKNLQFEVRNDDYVLHATAEGLKDQGYTHAILNPPYKKISSKSDHRLAMRSVGIETVNLYSCFVALALGELSVGGQLVAIIPRSFCNGPYYRPFRDFIFERAAIKHIHLFDSRKNAFKDDDVLQENVIVLLERGTSQCDVRITTSTDDSFSDMIANDHPFDRIVYPNDPERFIHIPTTTERSELEELSFASCSITDVGVKVSTGPVVDFRLKPHLKAMPEDGTVPLIYPGHLSMSETTWPLEGLKKPNAILRNQETEKWLYPNGYYCVVRRFSSKEEKRRIVASLVDPNAFGDHTVLGFENHMNLFHENKHGLPELLARGLVVFLNSTAVDEHFRRFNGHTQVNATDLKLMKYPSRDKLVELGAWAKLQSELSQELIDSKVRDMGA